MNECKIKVWITRQSAFSIQCGGLERLFINYTKPEYFAIKYDDSDFGENSRNLPFDDVHVSEGLYRKYGWLEQSPKTWVHRQSVGNLLGYNNDVSNYIWSKLCEHFLNEPFDTWHELERLNKVRVEDFLLEMELIIKL